MQQSISVGVPEPLRNGLRRQRWKHASESGIECGFQLIFLALALRSQIALQQRQRSCGDQHPWRVGSRAQFVQGFCEELSEGLKVLVLFWHIPIQPL